MISRLDFFLLYPLYFFLFSASLLTLFVCLCLISFLLFHARVFGKTLLHEFPISCSHTESCFPFLSLVPEKLNMPSGHCYRHCSWIGRSNHIYNFKKYIFCICAIKPLLLNWTSLSENGDKIWLEVEFVKLNSPILSSAVIFFEPRIKITIIYFLLYSCFWVGVFGLILFFHSLQPCNAIFHG